MPSRPKRPGDFTQRAKLIIDIATGQAPPDPPIAPESARAKVGRKNGLKDAKQGQEVLITERGRPVARLVALSGPQRAESRRQRLARAGLLALGSGKIRPALRRAPKGPPRGASVLRALLDERSEER